ncbi:MAG: hypothetical protein V4635_09410 [Bacteroidota bacterium]
MNDSLTNKYFYLQTLSKTSESVSKDLHGIHTELIEYNKLQRQEKPQVSSDTIYTVKVTLFIFIIGIIIDRLLKLIDRKWKEANSRKYFIFHLNQINTHLTTKLRDAYKKFHDITDVDTGITSTPPIVISSDFQRLLTINHEEIFKAYAKKEILSKIMGQIAFIDKVQIQVAEFHERVREDSGKVRDELENKNDEYLSLLSKYIEWEKQNNPNHGSSETYNLINGLVIKYYKEISGTRKLTVFYSDIIRVIQEKIVSTNEFRTHLILAEVAENGRKLSHLITKLTDKTKEITDQYLVFSNYMDSAKNKLDSLIPTLK